jgi:3-hydroxybutyrate dehydrogenase
LESYDAMIGLFTKESSIKRPNKVEEVAAVAVLMASDAGKNITACMFPVDGGTMPY